MKAITFLGTANYQPTTYVYTDSSEQVYRYETPFFAEALVHFFPDLEQIVLLATPTVKAHENSDKLRRRVGDRLAIKEIPESHSEADLWAIFDVLTEVTAPRDHVIFDITNSLRSIPFLTFLAAAYLRTARDVDVEAVLYGAFEARDRETGETPVFNLTPFVRLLDWLTATQEFIYTGDANYLARLVSEQGRAQGSAALKTAGRQLRDLSLAMMLCRPLEVMETAGELESALQRAERDLAQYARPFGLLARRIEAEYAERALADPTEPDHVVESLRQQVALIDWYLNNHQVMQAMTLAREWLITAAGWRLGKGFALSLNVRERAGDGTGVAWGLSGLTQLGRPLGEGRVFSDEDLNPEGKVMRTWPEWALLQALMRAIQTVRNELDHAGMNKSPIPARTLARKARRDVWPRLRSLAEAWDLLPT
jgi:hypothetical protein